MTEECIPISAVAQHLDFERQVAELAWQYYEQEGRPEGRALEHWSRAERELRERHSAAGSALSAAD